MVSAMDEAVGNVTRALKETGEKKHYFLWENCFLILIFLLGLYNNTIIIFSADVSENN